MKVFGLPGGNFSSQCYDDQKKVRIGSLLANQHMLDPSSKANIQYLTIITTIVTVCGLASHVLGQVESNLRATRLTGHQHPPPTPGC